MESQSVERFNARLYVNGALPRPPIHLFTNKRQSPNTIGEKGSRLLQRPMTHKQAHSRRQTSIVHVKSQC